MREDKRAPCIPGLEGMEDEEKANRLADQIEAITSNYSITRW